MKPSLLDLLPNNNNKKKSLLHCLCSSVSGSPVPVYQSHRNHFEEPISY